MCKVYAKNIWWHNSATVNKLSYSKHATVPIWSLWIWCVNILCNFLQPLISEGNSASIGPASAATMEKMFKDMVRLHFMFYTHYYVNIAYCVWKYPSLYSNKTCINQLKGSSYSDNQWGKHWQI